MEREIGDLGRQKSPLEANMRFPFICKRIDTSHQVLLLALQQNFVSLFTAFQKIVWIQLLSDASEIHKIAEVTGFFAAFVLIQAQANISVKCLSVFFLKKHILPDRLWLRVGLFNSQKVDNWMKTVIAKTSHHALHRKKVMEPCKEKGSLKPGKKSKQK